MTQGPQTATPQQVANANSQPWPSTGWAWSSVILLMIAFAFSYIDRSVLYLVVQPVKEALKLSDTQIGVLQGPAFGLLFTLATIPVGWLTDGMNRTRLLALGIAFWSVMTAASGLSMSFGQLFVARMGIALGESTISPTGPSLMADTFPPERRTLPLSLYTVAGGAGSSIALIAGGFAAALLHDQTMVNIPGIGSFAPWQIICFVVGAPGLIVSLMFLFLREPPRRTRGHPEPTRQELGRVLMSRRAILIPQSAGICLYMLQAFAVGAWMPAFFMRVHHWSMADAGMRLGAAQLVMGPIGGIGSGWTARLLLRRGLRDANLVTAAAFVAAMAPMAIAGFLVPSATASFVLLAVMTGFAHGPSGCSLASIQETIPSRLRGRVTAFYYAILGVASVTLGPLIIGLMNDYLFGPDEGIGLSLAVVSVLTLPAGTVLLVLAGRRRLGLDWTE
jgi:MFS family permease